MFEAFLVYYLLQVLVIALGLFYIYYTPRPPKKPTYNPWGFWDHSK